MNCDRDRFLFRQGDEPAGLFIVHGGEVVMTMDSPGGNEVVSFRADPGSLLGLPGLIGNTAYSLSAQAMADAEVSFVAQEDFSSLMISEPGLSLMILRVLANEVRAARSAITGR